MNKKDIANMTKAEKSGLLLSMSMRLYHEKDGSERTPEPEEIERFEEFEAELMGGDEEYVR